MTGSEYKCNLSNGRARERGLDTPPVSYEEVKKKKKDNVEDEDELCKAARIVAQALFAQACYE